jgi:hypothetical protein
MLKEPAIKVRGTLRNTVRKISTHVVYEVSEDIQHR